MSKLHIENWIKNVFLGNSIRYKGTEWVIEIFRPKNMTQTNACHANVPHYAVLLAMPSSATPWNFRQLRPINTQVCVDCKPLRLFQGKAWRSSVASCRHKVPWPLARYMRTATFRANNQPMNYTRNEAEINEEKIWHALRKRWRITLI